MIIYLDESGDFGWTFDNPFRKGGSSRHLTLAFLFVPKSLKKKPQSIIRSLYKKYGWLKEKKATEANLNQKIEFAKMCVEMLINNDEIKVDVITVKKEKVREHIRADSNKLYNYMSGLVIPNYVKKHPEIVFIPDERSIKVKSGNSLSDYLQIQLWFHHNCETKIICTPMSSEKVFGLQFVDWLAHCIWIKYEDSIPDAFNVLCKRIKNRELYF